MIDKTKMLINVRYAFSIVLIFKRDGRFTVPLFIVSPLLYGGL